MLVAVKFNSKDITPSFDELLNGGVRLKRQSAVEKIPQELEVLTISPFKSLEGVEDFNPLRMFTGTETWA
ncbi:MAG: hypothetical protein NC489_25585 [Ruminococcus flavefaciens]|nr:hypothetical protein [Ruminococcus flavefaciens]